MKNSSEKRNPGFAPIRRGLLEHWPTMSVNARAFYIWLHLRAHWSGPKRGRVEASFDDMARGNGWSSKTLQRTIDELEAKPFIEVERATNQYELTRVRILKYDLEEPTSALDKSDQRSMAGVDTAVDSGVDKFDRSTAHTKPPSQQNQHDLPAPKKAVEVKKEKKGMHDAVRRPIDAELRIATRKSFSPSERKKKLATRIAESLMESGNAINRDLDDGEREAFAFIKYKPEYPSNLPGGFVCAVVDVYEDRKDEAFSPGILCSKIIDHCMSEQKSYKTLGMDPSDYYWPPDFQAHRDRLRAQERLSEPRGNGTVEARA